MISQVNLDGLSLKIFTVETLCFRYADELGLGKQLTWILFIDQYIWTVFYSAETCLMIGSWQNMSCFQRWARILRIWWCSSKRSRWINDTPVLKCVTSTCRCTSKPYETDINLYFLCQSCQSILQGDAD